MKRVLGTIALAAAILAAPALAADNEKVCAGSVKDGYTLEQIVKACTTYIEAVNYPGTKAAGYYNRGNAYFDMKDFPKAIEDYTRAIGLRSKYPAALLNRGLAKKYMGDNAGGDADIAASKQ